MGKLFLILMALACLPSFAALNETDRAEFHYHNLLADKNPGAENGFAKWTASGGTLDRAKSGTNFMGIGNANFTWDASSAGQTLTSAAITIPKGYAGTNGLYRCKVMNLSGATTTMGVWDGTTLTGATTIDPGTTPKYVEIAQPFPTSGTTAIRFTSVASDEPLISIDDCYIGQNFELSSVNPITDWVSYTPTFTGFGTVSISSGNDCQYQRVGGDVLIRCKVTLGTTTATEAQMTLPSGLTSADTTKIPTIQVAGVNGWSRSTANVLMTTIEPSKTYVTFALQGASNGSLTKINGSTINSSDTIFINARVPISGWSANSAVRADTTPANWSGTSTLSGTTASTSYTDPGSVTGTITTTGTPRNLTCIANASSKLGIDCTLPRIGNYQVCYAGSEANNTNGDTSRAELVDGSGTIIVGEQATTASGANGLGPIGACGNYTASSTSVTFKVQAKVAAGTGTFNANSFSITGIDQGMPSPLLVGSVTSSTKGMERIERATVGSTCSSSPCTITSNTPAISSITRTSIGAYSVNFTAGAFSGAPSCTVSALKVASTNRVCGDSGVATTSAQNIICQDSGFTNQDDGFSVTCMGPR